MILHKKSDLELNWIAGKILFLYFWIYNYIGILEIQNNIQKPEGVFIYLPLEYLFTPIGKIIMTMVFIISSLLYLFEKKMLLATGILSLISIICISYQDSNGIFHRNTHYAGIFVAQWIAYLIHHLHPTSKLQEHRITFSIQIVAAFYFLAALSKLEMSGLNWFLQPDNFLIQIYKNHFSLFADGKNVDHIEYAKSLIDFFNSYPILLETMLGIALALEFFAFLMLYNDKLKYIIAIGLMMMHIGIMYIMGIGISSIAMSIIAWILNPIYLLFKIYQFKYST